MIAPYDSDYLNSMQRNLKKSYDAKKVKIVNKALEDCGYDGWFIFLFF